MAALPIRLTLPSADDVLPVSCFAPDQDYLRPRSFQSDRGLGASTQLLTCIAELERLSADLKKIVVHTGGGVGRSLREHHYELEAVVHKLARNARSFPA